MAGTRSRKSVAPAAEAGPSPHCTTSPEPQPSSSHAAHGRDKRDAAGEEVMGRYFAAREQLKARGWWRRAIGWLDLQCERYDILTGGYIFDWWEKLLMSASYLLLLVLVAYGSYKNLKWLLDAALSSLKPS